jgi:ankyrin repeat protein
VLLKNGANIQIQDKDGKTALIHAARSGKSNESIILLLKHGARIDHHSIDGATPLIWAAGQGNENTVYLLLSYNADINAQDKQGTTALMEAVTVRSVEAVRELINRGANQSIKNNNGKQAIDIANKHRNDKIRSLLISK